MEFLKGAARLLGMSRFSFCCYCCHYQYQPLQRKNNRSMRKQWYYKSPMDKQLRRSQRISLPWWCLVLTYFWLWRLPYTWRPIQSIEWHNAVRSKMVNGTMYISKGRIGISKGVTKVGVEERSQFIAFKGSPLLWWWMGCINAIIQDIDGWCCWWWGCCWNDMIHNRLADPLFVFVHHSFQ